METTEKKIWSKPEMEEMKLAENDILNLKTREYNRTMEIKKLEKKIEQLKNLKILPKLKHPKSKTRSFDFKDGNITYIITTDDTKFVRATNYQIEFSGVVRSSVAKCNPTDTFNLNYGILLAIYKTRNKLDVAFKKIEVKQSAEHRKILLSGITSGLHLDSTNDIFYMHNGLKVDSKTFKIERKRK